MVGNGRRPSGMGRNGRLHCHVADGNELVVAADQQRAIVRREDQRTHRSGRIGDRLQFLATNGIVGADVDSSIGEGNGNAQSIGRQRTDCAGPASGMVVAALPSARVQTLAVVVGARRDCLRQVGTEPKGNDRPLMGGDCLDLLAALGVQNSQELVVAGGKDPVARRGHDRLANGPGMHSLGDECPAPYASRLVGIDEIRRLPVGQECDARGRAVVPEDSCTLPSMP